MSGTDQIFSGLVAETGQAGQVRRARLEASRGASYRFNGTPVTWLQTALFGRAGRKSGFHVGRRAA
jgi:hypothetical protein